MNAYATFLDAKRHLGDADGFTPVWLPDFLYGFQTELVDWAVRQGRAAIFADCGLGKTPQQLVWAENVRRHANRPVLIVTPLAVSYQTEIEAAKFGIESSISRTGQPAPHITITNYDRLHHFNPSDFAGTVCDESSAIKAFDGRRRALVTDFMRKQRYRLLCTATAAPNDYIELGTSSEALGHLGYMDVLNRFFVNAEKNSSIRGRHQGLKARNGTRAWDTARWRFKGHAEEPFWRWVASWARALRKPSDLGHDDNGFALPALEHHQHIVTADTPIDGQLFDMPARGLREEREELRHTLEQRCEKAAEIIDGAQHAIAWCHLNAESDRLRRLITGAVEVRGSDSPEVKEEILAAFGRGEIRVLVTKPSVAGWGLNWQHCHQMTFFPSHSYEQYYQAVRRCWRFGQQHPVRVDIITTPGGSAALANLKRKAAAADRMFDQLTAHMRDALHIAADVDYPLEAEVPAWAA